MEPLAQPALERYTNIRTLRVADGPDIVHMNTIAKTEMAKPPSPTGAVVSGTNVNIAKYGKYKHVEGVLTPAPGKFLSKL